jgi:hypothetical protein
MEYNIHSKRIYRKIKRNNALHCNISKSIIILLSGHSTITCLISHKLDRDCDVDKIRINKKKIIRILIGLLNVEES